MSHRVVPLDQTEPTHPYAPPAGVPLDLANSEAVERKAREEDERFGSSSAVIPGVCLEDGHPLDLRTPADLGVVRHAVNQRWPISPQMRQVIADTMMQIVTGADMARDKINAAKVIVAGDRINSREQVPDKLDVTVDVKGLSDEQLMARLAEIEAIESGALTVVPPPAG